MQQSSSRLIYRRMDLENDLEALVSLLDDVAQADQSGEQVTEESLREQLTWSGQDPAPNNWVAEMPDSTALVGYGMLQKASHDPNADLLIVVHPSWRRQGIGRDLFKRLQARATELECQAARAYVAVGNKVADSFVRSLGFEAISTYTRLAMTEIPAFPDPKIPEDFVLRSYSEIEQVSVYTEALNRCYQDYWGHLHCTEEDVAKFLPYHNPAGIFMLFAPDGTIAATCRANMSNYLTEDHGVLTALIDAPGIVACYRIPELALTLVWTAIHWLFSQHPERFELEAWGETPEMLASYRMLGFAPIKEEISYCREL